MNETAADIVATSLAAFFVVSESGDISVASRGLYAVPAAIFLERGIDGFDLILADHERLRFAETLSRILDQQREVTDEIFQTNMHDTNGSPSYFSLTAARLPAKKPIQFMFEIRDRSQLMRKEHEVARLQREVQVFKEISYIRQIKTNVEAFFSQVLQSAVDVADADAALLYVDAETHEELLVQTGIVAPSASIPAALVQLSNTIRHIGRVSLYRTDAATPQLRPVGQFNKLGWRSVLVMPLMVREQRAGTLILLSKQSDAFSWEAIRLATSIASYLGAFVATELLWRQKEQLTTLTKSVFAYSPDGLFILDRDGVVGERNALTEKIIGSAEGAPLHSFVTEKYVRRVKEFLRQLRLHRSARVTVVFKADPIHTFEISATPLTTGEMVQHLCVARNVTGWVDERSALQQRNDQLAEIDRIKDEFVSMVSHELRSPLTVVMGNVSLLEKVITPDQQPLVRDTQRNIDRLNRLVRDILEITRLEYADITFDTADVELSAIAEVVRASVQRDVKEKQIIWSDDIDSVTVYNDPVRLTQIVTNLVSNAVRHTPSGGKISVTMHVDTGWLTIAVIDTGDGMTEEQQRHIFERFYRGEHGTTGFGLGLYIVKKLLERMGGRVTVKSIINAGTTIIVQIPQVV